MHFKRQSPDSGRQRPVSDLSHKPTIYSYRARRSEIIGNTGRQMNIPEEASDKQSPKNFRFNKLYVIVLFGGLCVLIGWFLSLSSTPRLVVLSSGSISSNIFLQNTTIYLQAAEKQFGSSIWNDNKVSVEATHISAQLTKMFPELVSVSVTIPFFAHQPVVYIQPAEPAIMYNASNGTYIVDYRGIALQSESQVPAAAKLNLPVVTNDSTTTVQLGQHVLTSTDVSFIRTVVYELANRKFTISGFTVPAGSGELDATLVGQPYYVKFNLENNDPRQQAGTFLAVQAYLTNQHITPQHYIDVRVDGRAYYQ